MLVFCCYHLVELHQGFHPAHAHAVHKSCKQIAINMRSHPLLMFLGKGVANSRYICLSALMTLTVADGNQPHYLERWKPVFGALKWKIHRCPNHQTIAYLHSPVLTPPMSLACLQETNLDEQALPKRTDMSDMLGRRSLQGISTKKYDIFVIIFRVYSRKKTRRLIVHSLFFSRQNHTDSSSSKRLGSLYAAQQVK